VFLPVPEAGDFRIDVNEASKAELQEQYKQFYDNKLTDAMNDAWGRLHECVTHMSAKLANAPVPRETKEGPNYTQVFRDSLVTNAIDLCALLSKLNVTNDPKMERMRVALEQAVSGKSAEDLRKSDDLREQTKAKID